MPENWMSITFFILESCIVFFALCQPQVLEQGTNQLENAADENTKHKGSTTWEINGRLHNNEESLECKYTTHEVDIKGPWVILLYTIDTPNYPNNYTNNSFCNWTFPEFHEEYLQTEVYFTKPIDIEYSENCQNDALEVLDEKGEVLRSYCGRHKLPFNFIHLYQGPLTVRFRSDSQITGHGAEVNVAVVSRATPPKEIQADSVYTRWGKPGCANGAGDNLYNQGFAVSLGESLVCVNKLEQADNNKSAGSEAPGLGPVQFKLPNDSSIQESRNLSGKAASCTLCHVQMDAVVTFIGMNKCPETGYWELMYGGFMMMAKPDDHPNPQTICMDDDPEDTNVEFPTDFGTNSVLLNLVYYQWFDDNLIDCVVCATKQPPGGSTDIKSTHVSQSPKPYDEL